MTVSLAALLLLQSAVPTSMSAPTMDEIRFDECMALVGSDPNAAIVNADQWQKNGVQWRAAECKANAYVEQRNFAAAQGSFTRAAELSKQISPSNSGRLWHEAGNAALGYYHSAAPQALSNLPVAIDLYGKAIASPGVTGAALGEMYMDRARAQVAQNDMAKAAADLTKAAELAPQNATVWLLSATLARRQDNLTKAKNDIGVAAGLAPQDPAIALEAGNIAVSVGDLASARKNWELASTGGDAKFAASARAHLTQLDRMQQAQKAGATTPAAKPTPATASTPVPAPAPKTR